MVQKFETFYNTYIKAETEVAQYALLKDFTLSLSLDELLAWNSFVDSKWQKSINETLKKGLNEEDKVWFKHQFAKFDTLEASLKPTSEHRQAA